MKGHGWGKNALLRHPSLRHMSPPGLSNLSEIWCCLSQSACKHCSQISPIIVWFNFVQWSCDALQWFISHSGPDKWIVYVLYVNCRMIRAKWVKRMLPWMQSLIQKLMTKYLIRHWKINNFWNVVNLLAMLAPAVHAYNPTTTVSCPSGSMPKQESKIH